MAEVVISNLVKIYAEKGGPGVKVVHGVSLEIRDGEFMVLVGPSGCGKSTTLRMVAGLEEISGGAVSIDGRVVNEVEPKDRDIAMVFQNYALYPHMTVYENLAFGLKLRKLPKAEIDKRVREASTLLGLDPYLDRRPKALSGGQRQRVAVGRAIVRQPKVFLFDEPLSNLDAKMRVSMRAEISKLHARLAATMIYVTHDQVEAMTMGDRICVMKDGRIMQVAEPLTLYNQPDNLFVAGFIGSPPMNFFKGTVTAENGALWFVEQSAADAGRETGTAAVPTTTAGGSRGSGLKLKLNVELARRAEGRAGQPLVLGIRPEDIADITGGAERAAGRVANVRVDISEPMGAETYLYLNTGTTSFIARVRPTDRYQANDQVTVAFDLDHAHLFDAKTENVIR
ncbi:MAG TPA: sn-glycerol-3-phosphate ABC transporter ATP-binding protein UgpC [Opitutaceae bacterium]|nr:sn-glycerol-3-phosphate ABC transporter ATP-binding protein UgpC [Opitutaceae bacterium]